MTPKASASADQMEKWMAKLAWVTCGQKSPTAYQAVIEAIVSEKPICVAEGEKAVEALEQIGVTATCSPGGAGKWRKEYSDHFKGADVVILPDADDPGEQHAISVAASLGGDAKKVRVLSPSQSSRQGGSLRLDREGRERDGLWKLVKRHQNTREECKA